MKGLILQRMLSEVESCLRFRPHISAQPRACKRKRNENNNQDHSELSVHLHGHLGTQACYKKQGLQRMNVSLGCAANGLSAHSCSTGNQNLEVNKPLRKRPSEGLTPLLAFFCDDVHIPSQSRVANQHTRLHSRMPSPPNSITALTLRVAKFPKTSNAA